MEPEIFGPVFLLNRLLPNPSPEACGHSWSGVGSWERSSLRQANCLLAIPAPVTNSSGLNRRCWWRRAGTDKALRDLSQVSISSPPPGFLNLSQMGPRLRSTHPLRGRCEVSEEKKDQSWEVSERDPFLLSCWK